MKTPQLTPLGFMVSLKLPENLLPTVTTMPRELSERKKLFSLSKQKNLNAIFIL